MTHSLPDRPAAPDARMVEEVRQGLSRAQKELPPTYFYDALGSRLFERITRLEEYYPTRTERALLDECASLIARDTRAKSIAELGAGTAEKSRILIAALCDLGLCELYLPVDVDEVTLARTASALRRDFPDLRVEPVAADFRAGVALPTDIPRPLLYSFLGSTIGNFDPPSAQALLARIGRELRPGDSCLIGVDLVKDQRLLEAAYNDAAGVTAEFNLNVLRVLNRELGARFDESAFAHRALYNRRLKRVEMHLVSLEKQTVEIPPVGRIDFAEGETILTEISCKYDRPMIERMLGESGLRLRRWMTDPRDWFALVLAAPEP